MTAKIAAGFLSLLMLFGCGRIVEPPKAEYRKITAEQAMDMMKRGGPYILLDTRTEEEFVCLGLHECL